MVEWLEGLGYAAEDRGFESRLGLTGDWKTLSSAVNVYLLEPGKDIAAKGDRIFILYAVPKVHRYSRPPCPYDYGRPLITP